MKRRNSRMALLATFVVLAMISAACGSSDDEASDAGASSVSASSSSEAAPEPADDEEAESSEEPEEAESAENEQAESEPAESEPAATEATETGSDGDAILRVGLQFGPDSGLAIESDDSSILMKAGVTEGLVTSDAAGEPVPGLAESWERIDDVTWEFALRPGVVFHDGAPLNAAAIETAIGYITTVAAPPRSLGGLELSTEIVDDMTVRIVTSPADPILPLRLSSRSMAILSPAAYDSVPTAPIGSGPFQVTDFTPPDSLTVERFDDYWGETALLAGAIFRFLPDAGSRAAAIRADEIDVAGGIALADLEAVDGDDNVDLIRFSLPRTASLYANTSSGPMSNETVRQAVSLALDNGAIADGLLEGQFAAARGYFGEENAWAPQGGTPGSDPDRAAQLLDGVNEADRSIKIWTYGSRPELADIATVAQAQLQAAGFSVEIEVGDYTPLEERVLNNEHDLFLGSRGYYFDIADAGAVLTSDFTCEGGYNLNRFCSPEFDGIVAGLSSAESAADRQAIFSQAVQLLQDQHVGFPLVHDRARYAVRTDVEGLVIDPFEIRLLTPTVSLGG